MAGTGFGFPKGLLNNSTQLPPRSSPVLPIPPPPNFRDIMFQSIGRPPRLLERFSQPVVAQGSEHDQDMPMALGHEQQHQNLEQIAIPRNSPLSQAQTETSSATIDNVTRQKSNVPSRSPLTDSNTTASSMHILKNPFAVLAISPSSTQGGPSPSDPKFLSSPVDSNISLAKSPFTNVNTDQQISNGNLASMQLSYPSASPGPNAITDQVMEDVQPTRAPDRPLLQPNITRKYEDLRQIQAHLRSNILNTNSPNLASVALLTESACQKANALHADARQLCNSSQEISIAAQNTHAAAQALFKAADEVKGLAEGAKAELDRLSSNQQQNSNDGIRELFQAMDNWISRQEADEAALRARRFELNKLKKQKAELAPASTQRTATSPSSASATTSTAAVVQHQTPIPPAPPPTRQPLFFSATPEVEVKPQTWTQPPSQTVPVPSLPPVAPDLARRQENLRKQLKEKRSSEEVESRSASPSEASRSEQQRLEEGRKLEEQRQKEALARQLGEKKVREEERKAHEKAQKEKDEGERKKAREMAEAEQARKAAEAQKLREAMEVQRKAEEAAETRRKSQEAAEEAKRKAQAEEQEKERRKAEAEAEKQRMAAFLAQQKQERERQAKLAEEAKQRTLQEEKERDQRLLEEQARMKDERENKEKLLREQELRRQKVQADKNKALQDDAQRILAQRESRGRPLNASEMDIDTNPTKDPRVRPPAPQNPPADEPPPPPLETQLPSVPSQSSTSQLFSPPAQVLTFSQPTYSHPQHPQTAPLTPVRNPSLPPVAHFSPADSPPLLPRSRPPLQPTYSIHRLSGDGGNLPYRENPNLSPQAQAANLRHVANFFHLPLNLSQPTKPDQSHTKPEALVKMEPVQDDSSFLQVSGQSSTNEIVSSRVASPQSQAPRLTESRSLNSQQTFPPNQAGQSLSVRIHGSHPDIVLDQPTPLSSSPVTEPAVNAHHHQQQQQVPQYPNQSQLPSQLLSNPRTYPSDHSGSQSRLPQLVLPPTEQRSRSRSPVFRMGPDEYDPQLIARTPSDTNSDNRAPPPPTYYGRSEPQISAPAHWDHYSPAPSPPRGSNTYRPNYANRTRSPIAGRKRSRDYSPPPHTPIIRDYREFDDRRPRRYSRSPPPRRPRPESRSPSPLYADRPPLASRLTQGTGGGYSYRPPSPRDPKSSRPELLDRFTDARPPANAPTRPGRGRGRRGRGGPPPSGPTHASLEKRISGATLINRLEDPDPSGRL